MLTACSNSSGCCLTTVMAWVRPRQDLVLKNLLQSVIGVQAEDEDGTALIFTLELVDGIGTRALYTDPVRHWFLACSGSFERSLEIARECVLRQGLWGTANNVRRR